MKPAKPVLPNQTFPLNEITFGGKNVGQSEYFPINVIFSASLERIATSRFRLTWRERFRVLFTGNIWHQQFTYGAGYRPIKILTEEPTASDCI